MKVYRCTFGEALVVGEGQACVFDARMHVNSLTLKPFLHEVYPDSHHFVLDSDPKHTAGVTEIFLC